MHFTPRRLAGRRHAATATTRTFVAGTAVVLSTMLAGCANAGSTPAPGAASSVPPLLTASPAPVTALQAATAPPAACDRYVTIDGVGSGGERTPEGALQVWLDKPFSDEDPTGAPAEAPRAGWRPGPSDREGYVRFTAGTWTVDAREGSYGLWTVTQQGCEKA